MEKKTKILIGVFSSIAVIGLAWWGVNIYKKKKSERDAKKALELEQKSTSSSGSGQKSTSSSGGASTGSTNVYQTPKYVYALADDVNIHYPSIGIIYSKLKKGEYAGTVISEKTAPDGQVYYLLVGNRYVNKGLVK